ncbi:hypothetical protein GR168_04460 [Gordonia sp. JH63]|uniref:Integral membrane protein n=1 Tax=Gordonia hongkongensis TaxID=1701090 RepID=A0ABT6BNP5_9ACTN|nr:MULTISPECIES: hypothetical protein [Gordonia]MDF6099585.1 hypothetical protein [Gordonia hongkongensis]QHD84737.1 hypothetical protein GR168_04460 [Gordonia sp. JH63]UPG69102.1 hypothetical protein MVF96_04470 [Gordonia hongkongensis]
MSQPPYPPVPPPDPQQPGGFPGQQPPQYGQQPPQYGQQPPQQPPYGQQPPPQPQYGQAPPPPPPGGPQYGDAGAYPGAPDPYGAPGDSGKIDVGTAFSWAFGKFKNNVGAMILPGLAMFLLYAVFLGVFYTVLFASSDDLVIDENGYIQSGGPGIGTYILMALIAVVFYIGILYLQASIISGAVRVANGEPVSAASFLTPIRFGPVIGTAILVGIITAIGTFLCVLPGIIAAFFLIFSIVATIDKGLSPVEALKASFELVKSRFGDSLLTWLVTYAITLVGALLCGIGLIVAAPVAQLFFVHCWRRLNGAPIAPADPA